MRLNAGHRPHLRSCWRPVVWGGLAAAMVLPVVGMHLTETAKGDAGDFIFLAALLLGAGGAYELAARAPARIAYPLAVALAFAAALLQRGSTSPWGSSAQRTIQPTCSTPPRRPSP